MKEKTSKILLIVLSVLLAVSVFLNGWLWYGYGLKNDTAPTNAISECITGTTSLEACKSCCNGSCDHLSRQKALCVGVCKVACQDTFGPK